MVHYDNYRVKSENCYPFETQQQFYSPESATPAQISSTSEPQSAVIQVTHNPVHASVSSEHYSIYAEGHYHVSTNPSLLVDTRYVQQQEYYPDYRWNAWQTAQQPNHGTDETPSQYSASQYENGFKTGDYYAEAHHAYQHGILSTVDEMKERDRYHEWIGQPNAQNCKTRTKDKYRVVYTDHQRLELEKEFHFSRYITIRRKAELAVTLGLSERQVKIWFQNRRAKERKVSKKKSGSSDKANTSTSGSTLSDHHKSPASSPSISNPSPAPSGIPSHNASHPLEPAKSLQQNSYPPTSTY